MNDLDFKLEVTKALSRIETNQATTSKLVEQHEERLGKHDKWHWVQAGATLAGHGLEHMGGLFKTVLAFFSL